MAFLASKQFVAFYDLQKARKMSSQAGFFRQGSMRDKGDRIQRPVFPLSIVVSLLCLALFLCAAPLSAMGQAMTQDAVAADPVALVRRAVANELKPGNGAHPYRYKLHKVDNNRVTTKEIVETKDGDVARLVEYDGHPLGPVATQDELDRLNNLLQHPEVQEQPG
jgi:hypothetical protein